MEKITGVERGKYLYKLADLVEQQRDLLGAMEAWDSGKTKSTNAVFDVDECIAVIRYAASWADKITGKVIQNDPKNLLILFMNHGGLCTNCSLELSFTYVNVENPYCCGCW